VTSPDLPEQPAEQPLDRPVEQRRGPLARALLALVLAPLWVYRRVISPMTPQTCRYYPSCSAYAEQALKTHGALRGSWLALRRLGRCHPWTPGGVDHVPPARTSRGQTPASSTPVTGA
jgi:hypothetical protein